MIRYHAFCKRFGNVNAVAGLDLQVTAGETLALIGPNGSGKTTTLKAALGLVLPDSGSVTVNGADVATAGCEARSLIGYLPQRLSFPAGCTAREVMSLFADLRRVPRGEVPGLLDRVGLGDAAGRNVDGFSGGMRQRLGIAITLLGDPPVLILDEPTSALDPSGALMMRDILREISDEGRTVLLSSHDLAEVELLADRAAIFVRGRLAALGSLRELSVEHCALSLEAVYRGVTARERAA